MKFTPLITVGFSHGFGGEIDTSISMNCANLTEATAQEVREQLVKLVHKFDDFRETYPKPASHLWSVEGGKHDA